MRWLVMIALVAACGKQERQCGPDAYELEEYLKKIDRGLRWVPVDGVKLVQRDDLEKRFAQESHVARVHPRGISVGFGREVQPEELAEALQSQSYGQSGFKYDQILLAIDHSTPWSLVVATVRQAQNAGIRRVVFAFAAKPTVEPPPRTKLDDDLDKVESEDFGMKATKLAEISKKLLDSCPALGKAFGKVAMYDDPDSRLIKAMTPALLECNCSIDMAALRSLMYRLIASKQGLAVIDLDLSTSAARIELPDETPWRDAQKKLTKDMREINFAEPPPPPEELSDAGVDAR
jgi:hypothetical protein